MLSQYEQLLFDLLSSRTQFAQIQIHQQVLELEHYYIHYMLIKLKLCTNQVSSNFICVHWVLCEVKNCYMEHSFSEFHAIINNYNYQNISIVSLQWLSLTSLINMIRFVEQRISLKQWFPRNITNQNKQIIQGIFTHVIKLVRINQPCI